MTPAAAGPGPASPEFSLDGSASHGLGGKARELSYRWNRRGCAAQAVHWGESVSITMNRFVLAAFVVLWICSVRVAHAQTTVQVMETYPAGPAVELAHDQNFYLRLAYTVDQPTRIWAEPYFRGAPARAGSNPSRSYDGVGEALGWFFLMDADAQADEVRIRAGDGSPGGTHEVARYPVRVVQGGGAAAGTVDPPEWVTRLSALDAQAQRDAEESNDTPLSGSDVVLFGGFMLLMLALGILGFLAPAWGLWRWRGGWRLAAAVPAVLMAFVVLRIVVGTSSDPSSHNLWPFEVLIAGAESIGVMLVLVIARRVWPERSV